MQKERYITTGENTIIIRENLSEMRNTLFLNILGGKQTSCFFKWWDKNQFENNGKVIPWHPLTIKKWKQELDKDLPEYMSLFCYGYMINQNLPSKTNFNWFRDWRIKHDIKTLQNVADLFGISKQAVNNWYRRGQLPIWLYSSCLAIDDIFLRNNHKNVDVLS